MLWILSGIIILYLSSYLVFRKNQTFLKVRKWIDLATLIVTSVLVIAWVEIFHYSFYFLIYFFASVFVIVYLKLRLDKAELKKRKAQEKIRILKDEEELLEEELKEKKVANPPLKKEAEK